VDTDKPLKILFQSCATELLPLTGDGGAIVRRAGPVEIQALERRVDCLLELESAAEIYYRHLEFEDKPDGSVVRRCFQYNTLLIAKYNAPVLTTVIYLQPPRPKDPLVFRVRLGSREINRWAFEHICLWDMDAEQSLASDIVGLVPLVPLMHSGRKLRTIEAALRRIPRVFPPGRAKVAEDVLLALAGQYYTFEELAGFAGRDRMMQSSLYTEGRTEGRVEGEREICVALARKYHSAIFDTALPIIEGCQDPARLKEWALAASDVGDDEFLMLLRA
jgi:hypothetical protein